MTYIKDLHLRGFKSFNKKTELKFGPGLSCIVGANGSGKSNVLDSLCFVLGRMGTKSLRADNYSELVFRKKDKKKLGEAEVKFSLDNSSKVFPYDTDKIEILRKIKKNGQAQYKINGRNASRQQALELLSTVKVSPDGHNIILQGDINSFVDMRPVDKRLLIEEVAGISIYENRKEQTLKELAKVEAKLKEIEIILTEKETYLKSLESEKADAEKYKNIESEIKSAEATELHLKINLANQRKNNAEKKINNLDQEKIKLQKDFSNSEKDIENLKNKINKLEKDIEKKGGEEQLVLQKQIENLKVSIETSKNLVISSKNEMQRIENRKKQLADNLKNIESKINSQNKEKAELEKNKTIILKKEAKIKKDLGVSGDFKKLESDLELEEKALDDLQTQKSKLIEKIQKIESDYKINEFKISEINSKLSNLGKKSKSTKDQKSNYKKIIQEISSLANKDSKIALKIGDLRKKLIQKQEELAKEKITYGSSEEMLLRDRGIKKILELKKTNKGIFGTISELGKVSPKFSTALQVAAGARMKNIAVDNPDTAIKCLNILKESKIGIATFLPLSKIRTVIENPEINKAKSQAGVYGLASDLISCDKKLKPLFKYIFQNTLIIENVETAKKLGIAKYRMVTLSGDIFDRSGAITGGYRHKNLGIKFKEAELRSTIDTKTIEITALKNEIKRTETERIELETKLIDLRRKKAELEGSLDAMGKISLDNIEKEKSEILKKLEITNKEKTNSNKLLKDLENKINKKTVEKNALKLKIKELRFGEKKQEIDEIKNSLSEIDAKISSINATIDNALEPERKNISYVVKELEKEKIKFKKQEKQEEIRITKLKSDLKNKELEEEKFRGKLRELFKEKSSKSKKLDDIEKKYYTIKEDIDIKEREKNFLAIEKAKFESELAGLKEEFKDFEKIKILEITSIEEAKKKARYLSNKLEQMGNVNMRALEIYDSVKKEFEELTWKTSKLGTERQDILEVIEEIESKKKDSFLETYNKVKSNFTRIFSKMTEKAEAELILENEENPFDGGITVRIIDKEGKHISLASLSGGEKVLVALSFIFSIQEFSPAPFYILDEIDAALDKVNSEKVAQLLKEYSQKAQVIIISHNDAIISEADTIYGVSMTPKTGESNIVSLKI